MDRINSDILQTFLLAADTEHLGRTADGMNAEQSTISRKIARLEEEVGVPLFERVGRSVRLTPAGTRFAHRSRRLLNELRDAIAEAQGSVSPETGEVHLGFLHTVGLRWLPERIAAFLADYPSVRFTLSQRTIPDLTHGIMNGELDLGIAGPPPTGIKDLEVIPLFEEQIAAVVAPGHRLASATSCTLSELAAEPLILPRARFGLRQVIEEAFANAGITLQVRYEGDDLAIVQSLVSSGLGNSMLPLPLPLAGTRVVVVPISGTLIKRTMALCWDHRRLLPPAAGLFSQRLMDEAASLGMPPTVDPVPNIPRKGAGSPSAPVHSATVVH